MNPSIQQRLALSVIGLVLAIWIVATSCVAWVMHHEAEEIFDSSLQETSQRLLSLAMRDPGLAEQEAPSEVREITEHDEYLVYQVYDRNGKLVLRSHQAPGKPFGIPLARGFHTVGDQHFHVEKSADGLFTIQVAEPAGHRSDTYRSVVRLLLFPIAAILPLAGLAVLWSMRFVLRPIRALEGEITQRGGANLEALDTQRLPPELQGIGLSTNALLERLRLALDAERRFTANFAHELRTPIAAAMAQLQAMEGTMPTLAQKEKIVRTRQTLGRLHQMSVRLLQLARVESNVLTSTETFDLRTLIDMSLQDTDIGSRRELRYEAPTQPVMVVGDIDAIGIALQNILTNADRHATPGTPVGIELRTDGELVVRNDCAPIPARVLETLGQRFVRAGERPDGTGLGLWISKQIVARSGGAMSLASGESPDGRGFVVRLMFPRPEGAR